MTDGEEEGLVVFSLEEIDAVAGGEEVGHLVFVADDWSEIKVAFGLGGDASIVALGGLEVWLT